MNPIINEIARTNRRIGFAFGFLTAMILCAMILVLACVLH